MTATAVRTGPEPEPVLAGSSVPEAGRPARHRAARFIFIGVLLVALATEVVLVRPYISDAAHSLTHLHLWWVAVAVATQLASLGFAARLQHRMLLAGGTQVSMRHMIPLIYAANALTTTLPAGTAISWAWQYKRLRTLGSTGPLAGFVLIASSGLTLLAFGVLGLWIVIFAGTDAFALVSVAVTVIGICAVLVAARRLARRPEVLVRLIQRGNDWVNRLLRRGPQDSEAKIRAFIDAFERVRPRRRDWSIGFVCAAANWAFDLACLLAACRAVGADGVTLLLAGAAYLVGTGAASVTVLPGGLGVVDAAMVLALHNGGVDIGLATAAVLLYRVISFVFVVTLGWLAWAGIWQAEHRRSARTRPVVAAAARP